MVKTRQCHLFLTDLIGKVELKCLFKCVVTDVKLIDVLIVRFIHLLNGVCDLICRYVTQFLAYTYNEQK